MKYTLIFLFMCMSLYLEAAEEIPLTRAAEADAEAGNYDEAIDLLKKLEHESLHPWQRARLMYNIGTIYMQEGLLDEAMKAFSSIPEPLHSSLSLGPSLSWNIALIYYSKAMEFLKSNDYNQAIFSLRNALISMQASQKTACALQKMEGRKHCYEEQDHIDLRNEIKNRLSMALKKLIEEKIENEPVQEGIPFLLAGLNIALSHLDFLTQYDMDYKLKKEYVKLFLNDGESWLSLWDSQKEKLPQLDGAAMHYMQGLKYLSKEQFEQSRLEFLVAEASLSDLMHELWGNHPFVEQLQKLYFSYQRALSQRPLQTSTLYQLREEQKQLKAILKNDEESKALSSSEENLESSLKASRIGEEPEARFFLLQGSQEIRRSIKVLTQKGTLTPEEILEEGIVEQSHALELSRLMHEIKENKDFYPAIEHEQSIVIDTFGTFLTAVLEEEKERYSEHCQYKPWDQVIPLYEQGIQAGNEALAKLKKLASMPQIVELQEKALNYWKQALEQLQKPLGEDRSCEQKPIKAETKTSPEQAQPQEGTTQQDVLRLLQQMYRDDLKAPAPIEPRKGAKPW